MDQAAVAASLGVSLSALWSLSGNPQFPAPISNDGYGNVTWDQGAIDAFSDAQ